MDTWRQNIPGRWYVLCKGPGVGSGLLRSLLAGRRVGEVMRPGS